MWQEQVNFSGTAESPGPFPLSKILRGWSEWDNSLENVNKLEQDIKTGTKETTR